MRSLWRALRLGGENKRTYEGEVEKQKRRRAQDACEQKQWRSAASDKKAVVEWNILDMLGKP